MLVFWHWKALFQSLIPQMRKQVHRKPPWSASSHSACRQGGTWVQPSGVAAEGMTAAVFGSFYLLREAALGGSLRSYSFENCKGSC